MLQFSCRPKQVFLQNFSVFCCIHLTPLPTLTSPPGLAAGKHQHDTASTRIHGRDAVSADVQSVYCDAPEDIFLIRLFFHIDSESLMYLLKTFSPDVIDISFFFLPKSDFALAVKKTLEKHPDTFSS